jgi:hypothetical protein
VFCPRKKNGQSATAILNNVYGVCNKKNIEMGFNASLTVIIARPLGPLGTYSFAVSTALWFRG